MSIESILAEIDSEIARLTEVRSLLSPLNKPTKTASASKPGRKPGRKPRRTLSAEARKRIADAQRKRWAAQKAKAAK